MLLPLPEEAKDVPVVVTTPMVDREQSKNYDSTDVSSGS